MKVSLFITCLVDQFRPGVGLAMLRVFDRLGLACDFPAGQTCCGQPARNASYEDEARRVGRQFLRAFAGAEAVVAPSGSCVAMVRRHLPALFADGSAERADADALAARTHELSQFLVDVLGVEDVGAECRRRVTYHDSCHLRRELGVTDQPRRLLARVRGLELVEMAACDDCCGFGGLFAITQPDISTAMGAHKLAHAAATGAGAIVACDTGCLLHLGGLAARRGEAIETLHLAEVLGHE
jgi:L-lactate dehydrogenase complex protein LldE